jgi:phage-related protein
MERDGRSPSIINNTEWLVRVTCRKRRSDRFKRLVQTHPGLRQSRWGQRIGRVQRMRTSRSVRSGRNQFRAKPSDGPNLALAMQRLRQHAPMHGMNWRNPQGVA